VTILWAIFKPCCKNRFATPEVAICTENIVILALGVGIGFQGGRLDYPPHHFVEHLSVCLPLLIQPLLRKSRNFIGIGRRATITTVCVEGILQLFDDRLPIIIYTGHSFLSPAEFDTCVPSDMKMDGTSVFPTLSIE